MERVVGLGGDAGHKMCEGCRPGSFSSHEFYETYHSLTFHFMNKDFKRCCDTTTPESIHTKDESKRGSAFAFIFGVN